MLSQTVDNGDTAVRVGGGGGGVLGTKECWVCRGGCRGGWDGVVSVECGGASAKRFKGLARSRCPGWLGKIKSRAWTPAFAFLYSNSRPLPALQILLQNKYVLYNEFAQ